MNELRFKTEQEKFWAGDFGNKYVDRNKRSEKVISNIALFCEILRNTEKIESVIEFGANIGLNLIALQHIIPEAKLHGIEINKKAYEILEEWGGAQAYHQSVIDYKSENKFDFVFTKGLLIHINPDQLSQVYASINNASKKYVCMIEYYNPNPVEVAYRKQRNKLFKRDFAGEMLERYCDLDLVSYGFVYHRDVHFSQDDLTWFLLKK